jgi:hypothetical protein
VITITGFGDHNQPEWLIIFTGIRTEQRFNLPQVTHLRFTIVPNKSGSGTATLTALRLFA